MMKKLIAVMLFLTISIISLAQQNYQDVVYLKNGGIIHGIIIELIPNKSIKIQTTDNNVFAYQMDEIDKIIKEPLEIDTKQNNINQKRKGYIGLSLGPSFPLGDFKEKNNFPFGTGLTGPETTSTGLQFTLVNFGYLFTEHFGIAGSWFGAAYSRSSNRNYELDPWSCGALMVGPLLSYPISEKLEWDLRPMIGCSVCSGDPENTTPVTIESSMALIVNLGTVFRIHAGKRFSFLLTADYFSTKLKFEDLWVGSSSAKEQAINAISLGFGFAYRLKSKNRDY